MAKIDSYCLNLAGEYRICSELNKRGVFATITYGNRKGADVYAIGNRVALRIEVKTSQNARFVTSITQKGLHDSPDAPHFWALVLMKPLENGKFQERFFILSHDEIVAVQKSRNAAYASNYRQKHGSAPDFSKGVDNVLVADVEAFEDQWERIVAVMREDLPSEKGKGGPYSTNFA